MPTFLLCYFLPMAGYAWPNSNFWMTPWPRLFGQERLANIEMMFAMHEIDKMFFLVGFPATPMQEFYPDQKLTSAKLPPLAAFILSVLLSGSLMVDAFQKAAQQPIMQIRQHKLETIKAADATDNKSSRYKEAQLRATMILFDALTKTFIATMTKIAKQYSITVKKSLGARSIGKFCLNNCLILYRLILVTANERTPRHPVTRIPIQFFVPRAIP
uniref:Uncharacterized protein n=1 Tax=Romanomermis culicivorax TaxID=13658 RepID=A0A915IXC1_ROMCU